MNQNMVHQECMFSTKSKLLSEFLANDNITPDFYNAQDVDGNTPLHLACKKGHVEIVQTLLAHSKARSIEVATENHNGITPLQLACLHGHCKIVRLLQTYYSEADFPARKRLKVDKTENCFQCFP